MVVDQSRGKWEDYVPLFLPHLLLKEKRNQYLQSAINYVSGWTTQLVAEMDRRYYQFLVSSS